MNARRRIASRRGWPANLYCRADGYYWYRNPENGKTKGLGRDRVKAFDEARTANLALSKKKASSLADWVMGKDKLAKTMGEYALEYEASVLASGKIKLSSARQLRTSIQFICAEPFADKDISEISVQDIALFLKRIETERGPSSALQRRHALNQIFFEAEANGLIKRGENPVTVTRNPRVTVKRDRLSLEQFLKIREHASGWLVNAMDLALITGQRREDLGKAKFADVKDGFWYCTQSKTGTKLRIATSLRLNAIGRTFEDVIKQCRDDVVSKHLIHHRRSSPKAAAGAPVAITTISTEFAWARQRSGITWGEGKTPPTFHEIRSLAERLYYKEYGSAFTQNLLGHKDAKMTAIYHDLRGSDWIEVSAAVK